MEIAKLPVCMKQLRAVMANGLARLHWFVQLEPSVEVSKKVVPPDSLMRQ